MTSELIANKALATLARHNVQLDDGLTDGELERVEEVLGVRIPPDLRLLLSLRLPVGDGFPDWRNPASEGIAWRLDGPTSGILFDVKHNRFWYPTWPERPSSFADAIELAKLELAKAPRLIPVCFHRFLPSDPCEFGNPVLSVMQTDIIYYGTDLAEYFENELARGWKIDGEPRSVPFWTYFLEMD